MDLNFKEGHIITTPSVEGGLIVINDSYYGQRPLRELELEGFTPEDADAIQAGDPTAIFRHFEVDPDRPGVYKLAGCIGRATLNIPGSRDGVTVEVGEIQEFEPHISNGK